MLLWCRKDCHAEENSNICRNLLLGNAEAAGTVPPTRVTVLLERSLFADAQEMNELRFVLVPKRLTDEQFWSIYFALTRARLPKEAFDTSLQAPPQEPPKPAAIQQVRLQGSGDPGL